MVKQQVQPKHSQEHGICWRNSTKSLIYVTKQEMKELPDRRLYSDQDQTGRDQLIIDKQNLLTSLCLVHGFAMDSWSLRQGSRPKCMICRVPLLEMILPIYAY